jgi:penicillin-binding protein 2
MVTRIRADGTEETVPLDPSRPPGAAVPYKAPAGSVTVMNYQTGQILAMASYPTFDNRWFNSGVDSAKFDELFPRQVEGGPPVDPDLSSLTNRAIQGQYNMGSAFKVFVAYAALATGLLSPESTYYDEGTYTMRSISPELCAQGVRCVYRNSTCPHNNKPCQYGSIDVSTSLAVSSDAFYYKLGEDFYLTPGTPLQDYVRQFGFGADTGIDLPFEFDGRVPSNELKAQLLADGVLDPSEIPTLTPGDLLQMAIGQGLMAASPLQMAVGYSAIANGGMVLVPKVVQAILEPEVPDGDPGFADLSQAVVVAATTPEGRQIPMPAAARDPIMEGIRRNVTGPGANGRSTTAEELFAVNYPPEAIPVGGKTGTAQGQGNYPWNDSSAFAAVSVDPAQPYTIVSYLEKAGFGSTGAAPVVKCTYLAMSGMIPLDPVAISEPLDVTSDEVARPLPAVDNSCMASSDTGTFIPSGGD